MMQSLLGTLFAWGVTACLSIGYRANNPVLNRKILDAMLGFAAGVMLAASYWSLLAPGEFIISLCIFIAQNSN
jgi:ZIP family zinc transporter